MRFGRSMSAAGLAAQPSASSPTWAMWAAIIAPLAIIVHVTACGSAVKTDPARILPVLKEAQRCCDGRCVGVYAGVPRDVACADVLQMESCLRGRRVDCPVKGQGAFWAAGI